MIATNHTKRCGIVTASLRDAFYRVIYMSNYEAFSIKKHADDSAWGPLESIHDDLHGWCRGGGSGQLAYGHMPWVPVAAFDPIFWLHHWYLWSTSLLIHF